MTARSRERYTTTFKGEWGRFGSTFGGHQANNSHGYCGDHTGPGDCTPLDIQRWYLTGGKMNKGNVGDYWSSWFKDYQLDAFDTIANFPLFEDFDGDVPNEAHAAKGAARSNPSRPYVDVPVMLFELKDLIPLIRDRGREILRGSFVNQLAQANLMYRFGLAPLVGDTIKASLFHNVVQQRIGELTRLESGSGLRRTVTVGSYCRTGTINRVLQSSGAFIQADLVYNATLDVRCHCRWYPTSDEGRLRTDQRMRDALNYAVRGLTLDASTAWELMPWSWMVDWFTNLGDVISANRNMVNATLNGVHIMRHSRTEYLWPTQVSGDIRIEAVNLVRERKTRAPSFVTPVAHFPFLNGNQVGILASLTTARR